MVAAYATGGTSASTIRAPRPRWTLRQEVRWLFELEGFAPIAEYSDFAGSPPAYGREQLWVARLA